MCEFIWWSSDVGSLTWQTIHSSSFLRIFAGYPDKKVANFILDSAETPGLWLFTARDRSGVDGLQRSTDRNRPQLNPR